MKAGPYVVQKADYFRLQPHKWLGNTVADNFFALNRNFYLKTGCQVLVFRVHFFTWLTSVVNGVPVTAYMNSQLNSIHANEYDIWIIPSNVDSSHWIVTIVILNTITKFLHLDSLYIVNYAHSDLTSNFIKTRLKTNFYKAE